MVAINSIEAEVSRTHISKSKSRSSSPKRSKNKMGKSNSPNHQPQLLRMLEEECHNSFLKLPDEEPIHIWNTDEVEEHNQRMKKLDKKLAKYNDDIAKLKEMLCQADEKHQVEMDRLEQREQEACQDIVDLEEASETVEQEAASSEVQFGKLQARLEANIHKIAELRKENKVVTRDLRKQEKQMDQLRFHNTKLEESSTSLMNSYSNLGGGLDKISGEHDGLCDSLEQGKEQYEKLKVKVQGMQEKYMEEATQRLEVQQTMADILFWIQGSTSPVPEVANACTKIGLDAEARAKQLMEKIDEEEEWRAMFAVEVM